LFHEFSEHAGSLDGPVRQHADGLRHGLGLRLGDARPERRVSQPTMGSARANSGLGGGLLDGEASGEGEDEQLIRVVPASGCH